MGGALSGAMYGLGAGAISGPFAAVGAVIGVAISLTVGGIVGGISGARIAVPSPVADQIERTICEATGQADLPAALSEAIWRGAGRRDDLHGYQVIRLSPEELDRLADFPGAILEIQVVEAGFQGGGGPAPRLSLYLTVRTRLLDGATRQEHYARDFRYGSLDRPLAEWTADDGRRIAAGLREAVDDLATRILDEVFLLTQFPFPSGLWAMPGTPQYGTCWFQPLDPPQTWKSFFAFMANRALEDFLDYPPVNSAQPVLRWEAFPRPRDASPENEQVLRSISDVTYDVKIWEAPHNYPERLVEDAAGLGTPAYRPRAPLTPHSRYYWTMRARYRLNGEPQVTRWAYSLVPSNAPGMPPGGSCDLDTIPPNNYFRFRTP